MKQAHLLGRVKGLRPSERRRLESLSHKRHPENSGVDYLLLKSLAEEARLLKQPLHMILDFKGLCRLCWIGPLMGCSQSFFSLPNISRLKAKSLRLISCEMTNNYLSNTSFSDATIALDFQPDFWLRFEAKQNSSGCHNAALFKPEKLEKSGWKMIEINDLKTLAISAKLISNFQSSQALTPFASKEPVITL